MKVIKAWLTKTRLKLESTKLGRITLYLISSHLGRMGTGMILACIFFTLQFYTPIGSSLFSWIGLVFLSVPMGYVLRMMYTAWFEKIIFKLFKKKSE